MHPLSKRIQELAVSATIAMAKKAREYQEQGIDIINLSLGEPDFKTPDHIREAAKSVIDEGNYFGYPPVAGFTDLREAIAEKLRRDNKLPWQPENIVVSTGAKQSIANVMLSLIDPGDEVIVFTPYWVTYTEIVKLAGGVPVLVKGSIDNDYKPTAAEVERYITAKTKLVIYSSPGNPTGSVFSEQELGELADLFNQHEGIYIISDEIYEYILFKDKHYSIGSYPGLEDRTITVNGFSKAFAMTGWRVGYIGAPKWVAQACEKMQGQFTSGANAIAQRAALFALQSDLEPTKKMAKAFLERRDLVYDLFSEIPGVTCFKPGGAFYLFPDISSYFGKSSDNTTINNASDLCMYLLDEARVSTVTGEAFGAPENIRISYAASEDDLKEAAKRISKALEKLMVYA